MLQYFLSVGFHFPSDENISSSPPPKVWQTVCVHQCVYFLLCICLRWKPIVCAFRARPSKSLQWTHHNLCLHMTSFQNPLTIIMVLPLKVYHCMSITLHCKINPSIICISVWPTTRALRTSALSILQVANYPAIAKMLFVRKCTKLIWAITNPSDGFGRPFKSQPIVKTIFRNSMT